jgi:SNF2 family DNA or RNA helicase
MTATMTRKSIGKIKDEFNFYKHQIEGIKTLDKMHSFILADEMGLGKSIEALTTAALDFDRGLASKVLCVVPAGLKQNWADEISEHTNYTWTILKGNLKQRLEILRKFDTDVLIVGYEQVIAHVDELNAFKFDIVLYDEAHYMKNRKSQRTKAVQKLVAPRHFLLTGSPLLNQVDELWTLLNRIDPVKFPAFWRFVNRYAVWGGYQDKQIVGVKNEKELRDIVQKYMLRREKKDVLDLPDKQFINVKLDMTPLQRKLYDQMREEMRAEAPDLDDGELAVKNAMGKFLRLKQICGTTSVLPGQPDESSKLDRMEEIAQELIDNGHPVVIFTQFRDVLACARNRLVARGIPVYQLHGGVPMEDRVGIVRTWARDAEDGRPGVILCMFQVAGVGLNMTAARHMIFLDKLFVPELNKQAEDRIHRIGADKTQPVQYFTLFMRNSVDTRIESILKTKTDIFTAVVSTDTGGWMKKVMAAVMEDEADE